MKKRFKIILACLLVVGAVSCSRSDVEQNEVVVEMIPDSAAFRSFAEILSKCVSSDKPLRDFIKEEALMKFDKDYDVFYPKVKFRHLADGRTFRAHLLEHTTEQKLRQIEVSVPKLTILVPDWSWISSFCAERWNTSDDNVYVGYAQQGNKKTVFSNGDVAFELDNGEVLETPTLIVKDNERIKYVAPATKGSDAVYEFMSPYFDGEDGDMSRGRKWIETTIDFSYEIADDFVPEDEIYPGLIDAYKEFESYPLLNACQRDYVYYGMNHQNTNEGILNSNMCERFYRFKVTPNAYNTMSNQYDLNTPQDDPKQHDKEVKHNKKHYLEFENGLKDKIWSDGSFEFRFNFYVVNPDGNNVGPSVTFPWSVSGSQLYDLKCVHKKYKKQTAVATGEYRYTFEPEDLNPKWVYMGNKLLPSWDLSNDANNLVVKIEEWDEGTEETQTFKQLCKFSHNFDWKVDTSVDGKIKKTKIKTSFGLSGGSDSETSGEYTLTLERTKTSDPLGDGPILYADKVIDSPATKEIDGKTVSGYNVRSVQIGNVFITLLPVDRSR